MSKKMLFEQQKVEAEYTSLIWYMGTYNKYTAKQQFFE